MFLITVSKFSPFSFLTFALHTAFSFHIIVSGTATPQSTSQSPRRSCIMDGAGGFIQYLIIKEEDLHTNLQGFMTNADVDSSA